MVKFELGELSPEVPYLKIGNGPKNVVIFPQTQELTCSFVKAPSFVAKQYGLLLPKEYTIYAVGYNPEMPPDETPITIVDRVAPLIREKIGKSHVVGISYGGPNAICFAARYPDLVNKLLLIVSAYKVSDTTGKRFIEDTIKLAEEGNHYGVAKRMITLARNPLFKYIQKISVWMRRKKLPQINNPLSTIIIAYKAAFIEMTDQIKEMLKTVKAPVFVFGGTKDIAFGEKEFRETAELAPNGKAILFEGAGHLVALEQFCTFKKKLNEIISQEES